MAQQELKDELIIHYVKTNDYKTSFASGAIGGVSIQGLIHMNLFLDRTVIPRTATYMIQPSGLAEEKDRETRDGSIREIHSGAIFDVTTAKNLVIWLNQQIDLIEKIKPTQ